MKEFLRQTLIILEKNFLMNWRNKDFLRELLIVGIFIALLAVINTFQSSGANSTMPFYLTLAIASYSRTMVISWVGERQTRQKEIQQIMGLNPHSHFAAWITYFVLNGLCISLAFIIPLQLIGVFDDASFGDVMGLYILYTLSTFFFVLWISTFFNDAKMAAQTITFVQLLAILMYNLLYVPAYQQNSTLLRLSCVFPPLAYDFSLITKINPIFKLNFTFAEGLSALGCTAAIYFVLFIYCEYVIPHEFGTPKHPLFFIRWIWHKEKKTTQNLELLDLSSKFDESSAKYTQQVNIKNKQSVQVYQLTKTYGSFTAVDKISFSLYEKQIFCLLGHNGAGKSTTINMLTGLTQKDSGKIIINGMDIDTNLDDVRKYVGICLQQDVLYQNLSVEDHLKYYCKIKGVPESEIQQQVQNTIAKCALGNQVGKLAKNLSGGNKRKLSLGNALVGGSKIVFLDQPSSGLDPNSRQQIWKILQQIKNQNRTVVLTTHHLQQAENLAQRVAIMTHGKLLILGSCDFIKSKFGIGYHLFITISPDQKEKVVEIVRQNFKGVQLDKQSATNVLKFILPLQRQKQFINLFTALQPLNLTISLKMSTLEDAFVNVGMNDVDEEERGDFLQILPEVQQQPFSVVPIYSFKAQFIAVFYKKAVSVLRSFSSVISVALPVIFMLLGTIITGVVFRNKPDGTDIEQWNSLKMSILGFFMIWAFIFNTSSYCGSIVQQREIKFKYLSNVMGLRKSPYWAANFSFDMLVYLLPVILFFIIVLCLGSMMQFLTVKLPLFIPVFILFGISFMTYSYLWSFAFQKSSSAYRVFPFLNFLFFFMIPMVPFYVLGGSFLCKYLMPMYSPFVAFFYIFFTKQITDSTQDMPSYGYLIGIMAAQAAFFIILTALLQNLKFSLKDRVTIQQTDLQQSVIQDQDVIAEEKRVANLDHTAPIVCDRLFKKHNNGYVAIRNNTFMVEQGEMFGLLGPNGAGKSTTFNIMTAAMPKTSGSVKLEGNQINKGILQVFQNVGVCPQFDSLYENLTVVEHLQYFARLKGNSQEMVIKLIDRYLKIMQLEDYHNVTAGRLSGGNKRKLSVSMALIGNPKLMFFDQPSSAVDPIARRFLWKTLNQSLRNSKSSIVLTTHSMNEAQSLCSRIGILIKGKFVCLGTPAGLRKRIGEGYSIVAKLTNWDHLNTIRQQLKKLYPEFKEYSNQQNLKVTFQIPSENFVFSKTFKLFENQFVTQNLVQSFEISEASLQQIFLHLSKQQPIQVFEGPRAEPWNFCCFQCGAEGCFINV